MIPEPSVIGTNVPAESGRRRLGLYAAGEAAEFFEKQMTETHQMRNQLKEYKNTQSVPFFEEKKKHLIRRNPLFEARSTQGQVKDLQDQISEKQLTEPNRDAASECLPKTAALAPRLPVVAMQRGGAGEFPGHVSSPPLLTIPFARASRGGSP